MSKSSFAENFTKTDITSKNIVRRRLVKNTDISSYLIFADKNLSNSKYFVIPMKTVDVMEIVLEIFNIASKQTTFPIYNESEVLSLR